MLTHRNMVPHACQRCRVSSRARPSACSPVLPFFHIYRLSSIMLAPLHRAGTVVTMPRFELAEFLRVIQDYRITRAFVVPGIVLALARQPIVDDYDLSRLELMLSGAAPLSAELEIECGKRLGCRMQQGYRMTEASPTTHFVPRRPGRADAGLDRAGDRQHRVPDRRRRDRRGRRAGRARRAVRARSAGDEGLSQPAR